MLALVPAASGSKGKKLEEVAQTWARGDLVNEEEHEQDEARLQAQLDFWNIEIEGDEPESDAEPVPEPRIYLWPENVASWALFLACLTQWDRAGARGERYRLNYPGVEIVMARMRIPLRKRDRFFADLQVMERAALEGWRERAERERAQG